MKGIEIAIEVGAIDAPTIARLEDAGYVIYQGKPTWRVLVKKDVDPLGSISEQAMKIATDILIDFRLDPLHAPPTVVVRYQDSAIEMALGDLILEDARRSSDPDPLTVMRNSRWRKHRDLGLGEHAGD